MPPISLFVSTNRSNGLSGLTRFCTRTVGDLTRRVSHAVSSLFNPSSIASNSLQCLSGSIGLAVRGPGGRSEELEACVARVFAGIFGLAQALLPSAALSPALSLARGGLGLSSQLLMVDSLTQEFRALCDSDAALAEKPRRTVYVAWMLGSFLISLLGQLSFGLGLPALMSSSCSIIATVASACTLLIVFMDLIKNYLKTA